MRPPPREPGASTMQAIHKPAGRLQAGSVLSGRAIVLTFLLAGLACPAAYADTGIPIAPVVGVELWLYIPFVIIIELFVVQRILRLGWKRAFRAVLDANAVSTVLGFPLLVLAVYVGILASAFVLWMIWGDSAAPRWLETAFSISFIFWAPPLDAVGTDSQSLYFRVFWKSSAALWCVVAFALSLVTEEWIFRHCRWIDDSTPPADIHRAVLLANLASYVPLLAAILILQ